MKKRELVLFGLCFLIISSCLNPTKVKQTFDESVPIEKSSRIVISLVGDIIGYNGVPVNWKNKASFSLQIIQIPAGDTLLEWNVESTTGFVVYRGKNILFRFNFQPQKLYFLTVGQKDQAFGLNVWAYNFDEKVPVEFRNLEHFIGFFPFLNTNQGTILLHSP
jgi:hypothetical protein